jgi:hypothetical protein
MKIDRQIDKLIDENISAIASGQETIDSILEKHPQYAHELRTRLEAVLWLIKARKTVEPRDGFISSTRKTMEDRFETVQPHGFWQRIFKQHTPLRWAFNVTSPVILILLLALIINNLILTARLSLPGDLLYPSKLFFEDIQLAFTFRPVDKTDLYIQLSRERTSEFVDLVLEKDYEILPAAATRLEAEINATLHSMNEIPIHDLTIDPPLTSQLRETLTNEIFMLNILKGSSQPKALPGIELAIQAAQSGMVGIH